MKNIINEKPNTKVVGRLARTIQFVDRIDIRGKDVVDVGCGYGWFIWNILKQKPRSVTALEVSKYSLSTASKYFRGKKVNFVIGSGEKIPLSKKIDTIVAWEVLEHLPKDTELKMFGEAKRLLRKDGVLYLSTPYRSFLSIISDPAYFLIGHRHYSKKSLINLGVKTGFEIEKLEIAGGFFSALLILDMYFAKWIFRRRPFFESFMRKKDHNEYLSENGKVDIFVKYRKK